MKVAIVTLYGELNYGNRLQNYAVQACLEQMGIQTETIVIVPKRKNTGGFKFSIKSGLKNLLINYGVALSADLAKQIAFRKFSKRYIKARIVKSVDGEIPVSLSKQYDYFVVGSDQVWNPAFGGFEYMYKNMFLLFTAPEKKVCFSPSFGVNTIPEEWWQRFCVALETFPKLSVREDAGAKIIKDLSGKEAIVLIDPTLMLSVDDWMKVSVDATKENSTYVLEYFLGNLATSDYEVIKAHASNNELKVKRLLDKRDEHIYASGPGDFISLIANASAVYTDSFHACVFSILFGTPFYILKRNDNNIDMYSRIDTLLSLFKVKTEEYSIDNPIVIDSKVRDSVLYKEREKVLDYLNDIIEWVR